MILEFKLNDNCNMVTVIDKLSKLGTFCFSGNVSFLDTTLSKDHAINFLNDNMVFLNEINSSNYDKIQSKVARSWCHEKLLNEELSKFENTFECQQRLKEISDYLDKIEKQKEGDEVARTDAKNKKCKHKKRK